MDAQALCLQGAHEILSKMSKSHLPIKLEMRNSLACQVSFTQRAQTGLLFPTGLGRGWGPPGVLGCCLTLGHPGVPSPRATGMPKTTLLYSTVTFAFPCQPLRISLSTPISLSLNLKNLKGCSGGWGKCGLCQDGKQVWQAPARTRLAWREPRARGKG